VDVREPWEYDTAKLPHFKLFPLSQASSWAANIEDQLDPEKETVVLCHHGMRSMQMAGVSVNSRGCSMQAKTKGSARIIQKSVGWACARSGKCVHMCAS
jgi:hypothetical protein